MALSYFYDPIDQFFNHSEISRLFDAALEARTPGVTRERSDTQSVSTLRPRMDLHESKDKNEMTSTFELPGMKKEDVNIDVLHNRLVVSGQSSVSSELDSEGYNVRERRFGRFSRAVPIPPGTKPEEIKANMEHGVLTVKFPKTQPEHAKRITIS